MGRAPCCDKANVKRGSWSAEEDETLKNYIHKHGTAGNWIALPSKAGLRRCGKSCRLRWLNYLRPDIRHGAFTEDEDRIIYTLYSQMGSRWSIIASQLHGRTDNDVKNHWNTKLKKKLLYAAATTTTTNNNNNNHPTTSNVIENYTKKSDFSESKTLLHATPPPLPPPMYLMDVGYGLTVSSGAQNYLVHEAAAAAASSSRSVSGGNSCSIGFDDKCVSWTTASSNQNNGVLMDDFEGFRYTNEGVNDGGFWPLEEKGEEGGDLSLGDFMYVDPDVKPQGLLQNVINPY